MLSLSPTIQSYCHKLYSNQVYCHVTVTNNSVIFSQTLLSCCYCHQLYCHNFTLIKSTVMLSLIILSFCHKLYSNQIYCHVVTVTDCHLAINCHFVTISTLSCCHWYRLSWASVVESAIFFCHWILPGITQAAQHIQCHIITFSILS